MNKQGSVFASALMSACLLAGTPAAAAEESFVSNLEAQGWTVIKEPDGNRRLYPPGSVPVTPAPTASAITVEKAASPAGQDQKKLISALTAAGWKVEHAADGSTMLRPPSPSEAASAKAAQPAVPAGMASGSVLNDTTLAILKLEALGWRVDKSENGSVLLYPPVADREVSPEPPPVAEIPTDLRLLDASTLQRLKALGWGVEYATDGSVLLYPPAPADDAEVPPEPKTESEAAAPASEDVAASDDAQFDILRARGWTVNREGDGTLLLYPPGHAPAVHRTQTDAVHFWTPAIVSDGTVELPVDTWSEVNAIAQAWVDHTGESDIGVGRIRQVFGVYIVSITASAAPHGLRHQISVRTRDGAVIQLD